METVLCFDTDLCKKKLRLNGMWYMKMSFTEHPVSPLFCQLTFKRNDGYIQIYDVSLTPTLA